jgi:Ca2+-binding RTX toxin-like protein
MKRQPWLANLFGRDRARRVRSKSVRKNSQTNRAVARGTSEVLETRVLLTVLLQFDYSLDANNFFDPSFPERRAALEAAGQQVSSRLEDTLLEIIPHKDDPDDTWTAEFLNPATGALETRVDMIIGQSVVTVFAGGRQLVSSLGIGGAGGFASSGTPAWVDRVRGRGQTGALQVGSETDFALWGGTIAFDIDANWHFDLDTAGLDSNESDFLSVALHELTHLFGFGAAASWENQVTGGEFTGAASVAEYDLSGNPPVDGEMAHWMEGITDDNEEVAMDPTLLVGTRKQLTELDFAALEDIGWEVTANQGGGGGGGGNSDITIQLTDGVTHSLLIRDDGIANNGRSEYVLDGGSAVQFDTTTFDVIVNGGDMSDAVTITSIDGSFAGDLTINAAAGNDSLSIDHDAGENVTFNGEAGNDAIAFTGAAVTAVTHIFDSASSGSTIFDDADDTTIFYTGLEPISDNVAAVDRIFTFAASNDVITLGDDSNASDNTSRISSVSSSETVDFTNPTGSITINAGVGNDAITVNSLDSLFAGSVIVNTGAGDDSVDASASNIGVTAIGAAGADTLTGSNFSDSLLGDAGNDVLTGGLSDDILIGGSNADIVNGGAGNDILLGSGGNNDVLTGGAGDDIMNGGSGSDVIQESADVDFTLTSSGLTGVGSDFLIAIERASLTAGISNNTIDVSAFNGTTTIAGGGGVDTVEGSEFADVITTGSGADVINGNGGDDNIQSFDGADTIDGGAGNDFADGGVGVDSVLGGADDDILVGSVGDDFVNGGVGNDIQFGGSGKDLLVGEAGDDQLFGQGSGGDTLIGGDGSDTMHGGGGNDTVMEAGDVNFTLSSLSLQGVGDDTLTSIEKVFITGGPSANFIDVSGSTGEVTVLAGAGDDTVIGGGAGFNVFLGDTGNDSLVGGDGIDFLLGASGADFLHGNGGDDILKGQGGSNDRAFGGDGNDFIDGGSGGDKLFGEAGADTMHGLNGNDLMDGGTGNDSMLGGDGDDVMNGGDGDDTLNGGAGNDALDGDNGNDGLSGFTGNDFLLGDFGDDTMYGGDGNDNLIGAAGADIVIGQGDDDFVKGNGGSDTLAGGSGSGADVGDTVVGNAGEIDELFTIVEPDWVTNI